MWNELTKSLLAFPNVLYLWFQMSTQNWKITNRGTNLRLECVHMIPNEHRKTRKTHVLITFISCWVPRAFAVSLTLVRYLSRNHLVRNFGKGFRGSWRHSHRRNVFYHGWDGLVRHGSSYTGVRSFDVSSVMENKAGSQPMGGRGEGSLRNRPRSYHKELKKRTKSSNAASPV